VTAVSDASVGLKAADRLAQLGTTEIQSGLNDTELADVEQRFGFQVAEES
jgi:hypothetical protein